MNIDLTTLPKLPDGLFANPLPINEILYEAEQPVVFTTASIQGQELLAYLADETECSRFIVVAPAAQSSITKLKQGVIGVRESLSATWLWLVKEDTSVPTSEAWTITESQIPDGYLPKPGTPLLPEFRPVLTAKAVGESILLGSVLCSVISFVAEAVRNALKTILDHVMSSRPEGRPTDAQRALYDLPVRQINFASFEIGLAAPQEYQSQKENIDQALQYLEAGLAWAANNNATSETSSDEEAVSETILRATLALTPPGSGVITAIEVGGSWLAGRHYQLNRASRIKVSKRLRQMKSEEIVVHIGRIGEIDDDRFSFTLRDVEGAAEQRGTFPEDLLDDMRTYYYESSRVKISGVVRQGKLRVTAVVANPGIYCSGD